jgi:hypothetical protein
MHPSSQMAVLDFPHAKGSSSDNYLIPTGNAAVSRLALIPNTYELRTDHDEHSTGSCGEFFKADEKRIFLFIILQITGCQTHDNRSLLIVFRQLLLKSP